MAKVITQDTIYKDLDNITNRITSIERIIHNGTAPIWSDVTFKTNWGSNTGSPVQAARLRPGVGILRGIVVRLNLSFSFATSTNEMFTLPSEMQLYSGGSDYQLKATWGVDSALAKTMYRVLMRPSDGVFLVDQVLTGGTANGQPNTAILFDAFTFILDD